MALHQRLSWQYYHRRAESWRVVQGSMSVATSDTDAETELKHYQVGERHRLVGLEGWGIIAEIWQHTHEHYPSDEDDIVRAQDDFGR